MSWLFILGMFIKQRGLVLVLQTFACFFIFLFLIESAFAQEGIQLGSILLKVSVPQGSSVLKSASISSDNGGEFLLQTSVSGVTLTQNRFVLQKGESKTVSVRFDSSKLQPEVYIGSLVVTSGKEQSLIPIIFEVESKDILFDVNLDIPPDYAEVQPGGRVVANLKLFDLASGGTTQGFGPTSLNVEYYIYNNEGAVVSSESESVVVDRQVQISKSVSLPGSLKDGAYVFTVVVRYKTSVGVSSYLFHVGKPVLESASFFESFGNWEVFAVLGVIVLFFFALIFLFVYLIRDRDKLLIDLKKYNEWELQQHKHLLAMQESHLLKHQNVNPQIVHREVAKKIDNLKKQQQTRVTKFERLKSSGSHEEMKKKLMGWKRAGYNTELLDYKLKGLSVREMKGLLAKWKRTYHSEGYKNKQ